MSGTAYIYGQYWNVFSWCVLFQSGYTCRSVSPPRSSPRPSFSSYPIITTLPSLFYSFHLPYLIYLAHYLILFNAAATTFPSATPTGGELHEGLMRRLTPVGDDEVWRHQCNRATLVSPCIFTLFALFLFSFFLLDEYLYFINFYIFYFLMSVIETEASPRGRREDYE